MTSQEAIELISKIAFSVKDEIEEIKASKFITALKMAKEALEKQIPKKPIIKDWMNCPSCNWGLELLKGTRHCPKCGQALDWSDAE